jgi:hypothetical protein
MPSLENRFSRYSTPSGLPPTRCRIWPRMVAFVSENAHDVPGRNSGGLDMAIAMSSSGLHCRNGFLLNALLNAGVVTKSS